MRASIFGAALVGAVVISCGPPPPPTTGRLVWSYQCDTTVVGQQECGNAPNPLLEGFTRTMPLPALDVGCFIDAEGSGFRFRVRIEQRSSDGQLQGLTRVCGTSSGSGVVANGRVSAAFGAARITNVTAGGAGGMGGCDVRVSSITANSVSGTLRCSQVRDNASNARRVNGTAPPAVATADPEWAEFQFANCTTGAGVCN
ncbi:MAG: hypothetical protein JNK05_07900 [Myxococcales bacterium]|nr:hypothetical protein [Myxococcales bacterium]